MSKRHGFTLIESMISLAIISLMLLCTLPTCSYLLDTLYLNQTLSTFRADLTLVRLQNMTESRTPWTVRLDKSETRYTITPVIGSQSQVFIRHLPIGMNFDINHKQRDIHFTSAGTAKHPNTYPLTSRYTTKDVVISIGTGGITIRDHK